MLDGLLRHGLRQERANRIAFAQQLLEHADAILFLVDEASMDQLTFVPRTQRSV